MARHRHHRRHHRRGLGDYVSVPSFGGIKEYNPLGKTVRSTDLFVGAGLGLTLGAAVKYLLNKANSSMGGTIPTEIMSYASPISTVLAGVALYMFQRKAKRQRAEAHFVGAALAGALPIFWTALGQYGPKMADGTPFFSDYVMQPYGLLTSDGQVKGYGMISADQQMSGNEDWDPMSTP